VWVVSRTASCFNLRMPFCERQWWLISLLLSLKACINHQRNHQSSFLLAQLWLSCQDGVFSWLVLVNSVHLVGAGQQYSAAFNPVSWSQRLKKLPKAQTLSRNKSIVLSGNQAIKIVSFGELLVFQQVYYKIHSQLF